MTLAWPPHRSQQARPLLLDWLDLPGFASDLAITGDALYVIYSVREDFEVLESGVIAVDAADPEALRTVAAYDQLTTASAVQAVDDTVFVADEPRGVVALSLGPSD